MRFFATVFMLTGSLAAAQSSTPAEWLAAQPKPAFKAGHTLPPLTRYGWDMDDAVRIALAEDWGYALEFGVAGERQVQNALTRPESREAKLLALAISDPQRYPLSVATSRALPKQNVPAEVWTRDASGKFLNARAQSLDGNAWDPAMDSVFSPASPDSFWEQAGELSAAPIRRLREKCRIVMLLNPGEYGLGVPGFAQPVWEQDPAIVKMKGTRPWTDFISERKAHFQAIMTTAERKAAPDRLLYLFYTCGGGTNRQVFPGWADWSDLWEHFKDISDLPSNEAYFRHLNTGWTGGRDMLTLALNAAAREIQDGRPLSYNWLSAGWDGPDGHEHGDLAHWTGFLKCYYTAGMTGGNAGYYRYLGKNGFSQPFPADQPPHWLQQLTTLAHIHAQFTHLEEFLRDGDLLPGPDKHRFSKELPAYEFPTSDATVRVLARKHRQRPEWLVTAWAADGAAREVGVSIPELGKIKLTARPEGTLQRLKLHNGVVNAQPLESSHSEAGRLDPQHPAFSSVTLQASVMSKFVSILVLAAGAAPAAELTAEQLAFVDSKVRPLFEAHCYDCHDADTKKGNLDLTALKPDLSNPDTIALWLRIHDRIAAGEMPPKKKQPLAPADRQSLLAGVGGVVRVAEAAQFAESGRTAVRRMNRTEYEHALRDLLSLPLLRVKELLPEDGQQFGFDKVSGALDISHIQMSKYLQAADTALRMALVDAPKAPETKIWRESAVDQSTARSAIAVHCAVPLKGRELAPSLTTQIVGNPEKNYGNTYRGAVFKGEADSVALLTGVIGAHQPQGLQIDRFKPSVPGWYRVKFSTWSLRWERTKVAPAVRGLVRNHTIFGPPYFKNDAGKWEFTRLPEEKPDVGWMENVEFYGDAPVTQIVRASLKGEPIGYFDAPSLKPKEHEFKIWLNPGEKVSFHAMTLPATGARNSGANEGVRSYEGPGVAYDWFEVEGPLIEQWPPASQRRLFGEEGTDLKPLLASFAMQAFRRPLTDGELAPYVTIVEAELKHGTKFDEAMIAGYKAILCSPDFLMIGLESGVPQSAKLGDYALASRLSYFLWNSMPDAALLDLAAKRELSKPATLTAQVTRMLADPRSDRFITHFLDEWLELKKIDFTTPDPNLYPEYDPWLHDSMLAESRASFRRMLTQNLGVREIIASDTLVINQRLAELYGIRGVAGSDFREIKVPAGTVRGGFLTQASVLKVTANGTATSPVLRGVWVMERILGIPRLPPPPNIPAIEPDATGAVTIRQMIEKHRADTACASCHAKMDPPGLALESFDAIGGWREHYRLAGQPKKKRVGKGKEAKVVEEPFIEIVSDAALRRNRVKMRLGSAVDASGELADGGTFTDINGLRELLLKDEDALARNVVRQLMIYATGAGVRFSDREAIDAIVAKTRTSQHGLHSIVEAVVASELFQTK